MKRTKKAFMLVMVAALSLTLGLLTACGESYEKQTIDVTDGNDTNYWELTVTNDEVQFNEGTGYDDLIVYVTAKNTSDQTEKLSSDIIATPTQNGETLDAGIQIEGNYDLICSEVEAGKSVDVVYTCRLADYSPVTMEFHGYTSAVVGGTATFDVEGRQTDEAKAAAEAEAAKRDANSFDIEYVTGEVAEGWYIDEVDDDSVEIARDDDSGASLSISVTFGDSAKDAMMTEEKNYPDAKTSTKTINGTKYQVLTKTKDMFALFAETSNGDLFKISGLFLTVNDAMDQLKKITVK